MNVKNLIELLKQFPPEMSVAYCGDNWDGIAVEEVKSKTFKLLKSNSGLVGYLSLNKKTKNDLPVVNVVCLS